MLPRSRFSTFALRPWSCQPSYLIMMFQFAGRNPGKSSRGGGYTTQHNFYKLSFTLSVYLLSLDTVSDNMSHWCMRHRPHDTIDVIIRLLAPLLLFNFQVVGSVMVNIFKLGTPTYLSSPRIVCGLVRRRMSGNLPPL